VHAVNAGAPIFEVSCKTGEGLGSWIEWLRKLVS
jgi:Ni2+-binding GTPase involved in maturation of urease and hydrogenase